MARLSAQFHGYIFDLDGTVYLGDRLIPGAAEAVAELRARGAGVLFLTNKPLDSRRAYTRKLTSLGISATPEDVINSSAVMADYLKREAPGARVYCIGEPPLLQELHDAGMQLVADPRVRGADVDFVVAAFDRTFDYAKLDCARCKQSGTVPASLRQTPTRRVLWKVVKFPTAPGLSLPSKR